MLTIRDPRAGVLARRLAEARQITMTQAVVTALEHELRREREATPLATRLAAIAHKAAAWPARARATSRVTRSTT